MADIEKEYEQNFLNEIRNLTKEATETMAWLMQNGFTIKAFLHTTIIAVLW